MDYRDSPEEAAFRDRLRGWLAERAGDFLERAVLATTAEEQSVQTDDFRSSIAKLTTGKAS